MGSTTAKRSSSRQRQGKLLRWHTSPTASTPESSMLLTDGGTLKEIRRTSMTGIDQISTYSRHRQNLGKNTAPRISRESDVEYCPDNRSQRLSMRIPGGSGNEPLPPNDSSCVHRASDLGGSVSCIGCRNRITIPEPRATRPKQRFPIFDFSRLVSPNRIIFQISI